MVDTLRMLRGMVRGFRRGRAFPAEGRRPVQAAPGGTTSEPLGRFVLRRHRVAIPGLAEAVSVLQISDAHVRHPTRTLARVCDDLAGLRPDLVVLTGDITAREAQPAAVHELLAHLPAARLGRFAIMGNWEYWAGFPPQRWGPLLARHGVCLLRDEAVRVGPITLVGTDDHVAAEPDVEAALDRADGEGPIVCLTHSPGLFPRIARPSVPLVLAGHTHGGQVRLPGLGAAWLPFGSGPYVAGFYEANGSLLYVSSGLGWSMAPLRVRCPPEIAWLDLVPGDA